MTTAAPSERLAVGRSLWTDGRARLARNPAAMASLAILALLVISAIFGPSLTPSSYDHVSKDEVWAAPLTGSHLVGTDHLGRDLLARVFVGLRVSLAVGVLATAVSLIVGVSWGVVAGYVGGPIDNAMMRIVDILYSLPFIFFVIILMVVFGKNLVLLFVAIGAVEWLTMARVVRGQTLLLKQSLFVEAARAAGLSSFAIMTRHLVPNLLGPVVIYATLTIPSAVMAESFLSFLGLGVQEPLTSLGTLISQGAQEMEIAPWLLVAPSIVMIVALVSLNLLGDGLRDALDPKDR